jgi:hypothetical protein
MPRQWRLPKKPMNKGAMRLRNINLKKWQVKNIGSKHFRRFGG